MRVVGDIGENLGPLRPHDVGVEIGLVVKVEAPPEDSLQIVEPAPAQNHQAVADDHLHGTAVVGHNPLQLVEDHLDRVLEAQRLPHHLCHGQERLRVLPGPLELGEITRLVDRCRGERGEGLCGPRVLRRVEVGLEAVDRQHPDQAVADEQGYPHPPLDVPIAEGIHELRGLGDVGDDGGLVLLHHHVGEGVRAPRREPLSDQLVDVRKALAAHDHELVAVELLDRGARVGHHLAQLGQNQIEDLGRTQRAPQREGCGAKRLGLFPSGPLRLEQACSLDRHRRLGRESGRNLASSSS